MRGGIAVLYGIESEKKNLAAPASQAPCTRQNKRRDELKTKKLVSEAYTSGSEAKASGSEAKASGDEAKASHAALALGLPP